MDKVVDKFAALGIPGLVLVIAMAVSGYAGAAALTAALAALGGPLGMLGGIGVLLLVSMASKAIAEYGAERFVTRLVERLVEHGYSYELIHSKIASYPISKGLRRKLLAFLDGLNIKPCQE